MSTPPTEPDDAQEPVDVRMQATASGDGRAYQAARDQYINERTIQMHPPAQVHAPPGLVNIPAHARLFVGRGTELEQLDAALGAADPVVVAAVHGLGGVGKSTLAARYAAAHAPPAGAGTGVFHPVWWITADTGEAVQAGLAALAVALQPELKTVMKLEELAEWALTWLGCHPGWLVVLDNVTNPTHIAPLLDRTSTGRVLVTSRLGQGWHRFGARVLRLDVLTAGQAVELLTRIATAEGSGVDLDGADELVAELGSLPLAIEQAAAYLQQNQLSPRQYLRYLADSPAAMYDLPAEGGDTGSDARTIARIWRITLDLLTTGTPLAAELLRILAWYAPEAIPRTLLDNLNELDGRKQFAAPLLQAALGKLAAYNMITLTPTTITVHRLVQALARTPDDNPDDGDRHRRAADITAARDTATRLLDHARPEDDEDPAGWPQWRRLLPHIDALADHTPPGTDTDTTVRLLRDTGLFLTGQGAHPRALTYLQRCLVSVQRLHDPDHPLVLNARACLAYAYRHAGDLQRAISLLEHNLTEEERVLGADHRNTLTSRNNLAYAYRAAGDLDRAIPLHEQTLADRERVLGADHPQTLTSRNNLAGAYRAAGDLDRAIPLLEQTLAACERVLGTDHPNTLTSRNNLASAYRDAGDLDRAIPLHEQTLTDRERVLGADHPNTLISRGNLAYAYRAAGDLVRAIPLYEQTLADCVRVLGVDHPTTAVVRGNLDVARRNPIADRF
ncbi:tetratricopeptide repeat protein [Actinomadura napierensis]|uniref:FxSxx-COOH system tetratricopeptide repeat protein n=1 Tax=Actinomadura napierensis TaxID=267854 RepID=A0ABP5MDA8_9ACTN